MIHISEKYQCCGCTACASACPTKCISMRQDDEGFYYPAPNPSLCVNCGACESVCPSINSYDPGEEKPVAAYVVRNRDKNILMQSTSGGFFYALCKYIISNHGVVYGVVLDENLSVLHARAETEEECLRFLGSKYVQSLLTDLFPRVKTDLDEGRQVCFSGTPCQVQGLCNYLGNWHPNLILVDIVCHGVASAKVWRSYLEYEEEKKGKRIDHVHFRSKQYGYQNSTMKLSYGGKTSYGTSRTNLYTKMYYSNIALRPSCYHCPNKTIKRVSDFTIYDSWNTRELIGHDDNNGYTSLLVQSVRGKDLLPKLLHDLDVYPVSLEDLLPVKGGHMVKSTHMNQNRELFFEELRRSGFESACKNFFRVTVQDQIIERAKTVLTKSSLFREIVKKKRQAQRTVNMFSDQTGSSFK